MPAVIQNARKEKIEDVYLKPAEYRQLKALTDTITKKFAEMRNEAAKIIGEDGK